MEPPAEELTLDEFEMLSLDRLQLLRQKVQRGEAGQAQEGLPEEPKEEGEEGVRHGQPHVGLACGVLVWFCWALLWFCWVLFCCVLFLFVSLVKTQCRHAYINRGLTCAHDHISIDHAA